MTPQPEGAIVQYDGQRYLVTAAGDVYRQGAYGQWILLPREGRRAAAVRHQLKGGHTS